MRRLLDVLFGLIILVFMTYYIFDYLSVSGIQPYIDDMQNTDWFPYVHYAFMAALVIIGLVYIIIGLRPTNKTSRLVWETESGNLEISKPAVLSFIKKVVSEEPNVVHHDHDVKFFSKDGQKTISGTVDLLWAENMRQHEDSIQVIATRIREKLTEFTEADCSELKFNVLDQHKDTSRRVI